MGVLIHIGYHKTGTNWLQRRFFSDPATGYRWLGKRPGSHPVRRFVQTGRSSSTRRRCGRRSTR